MLFCKNARNLLLKMYRKININEGIRTSQYVYNEDIMFGRKPEKLPTNEISHPFNVEYILQNLSDSKLELITSMIPSYNHTFIPYYDKLLDIIKAKGLFHCSTMILKNNEIALTKFFLKYDEPCKKQFIRNLPHPVYVEVNFIDKSCWSDSSDLVCVNQTFDSNFLPQWRCLAFLNAQKLQCSRFALYHQSFCLQHQMQMTGKPMSSYNSKRYYESTSEFDVDPDEYESNPNEDKKNTRYALTKRITNPMELLAPYSKRQFSVQHLPKGFYLPVIRYEGIFFDVDDKKKYCGKFFFYEPESNIYLRLGNSCIFASKLHAYFILANLTQPKPELSDDFLTYHSSQGFFKFNTSRLQCLDFGRYNHGKLQELLAKKFWGTFLACLRSFKTSYEKFRFYDSWIQYHFCTVFKSLDEAKQHEFFNTCIPLLYPTDLLVGMQSGKGVGDLDFLDQPICKMARYLKLDTVILQHEIGGHDCVTEILHTNDYEANLFRVSGVLTKNLSHNSKYAKLWFPNDNGIMNENGKNKSNYKLQDIFTLYDTRTFNISQPEDGLYLPITPTYLNENNYDNGSFSYLRLGVNTRVFTTTMEAYLEFSKPPVDARNELDFGGFKFNVIVSKFFRYGNCDFLIFNHPTMQKFMKYISHKKFQSQEAIEELLIKTFSTTTSSEWESEFVNEQIMHLLKATPLDTVVFQCGDNSETQIWNLSQQKIYEFDIKYEATTNNNIWYADNVVEIRNGEKQKVPCRVIDHLLVLKSQKRKLAIHY